MTVNHSWKRCWVVVCALGCGPEARPTSNAPLPSPSAVAEETKTPASDPLPHAAASPSLTLDECRSQPGEVLTDQGDNQLHTHGCPAGRRELGKVRVGVQEGLCCAPAPVATPPAPIGSEPTPKRPPCSSDQSCNDDPSVSALWGTCTPLGVCECKPGFELNVRGLCQRAVR